MNKIIYIISIIMVLSLMSFYTGSEEKDPPCKLTITEVNDSTFVIDNQNKDYYTHINIALGSPNVLESGDTVRIIGSNYNVRIVAFDSTGCVQQKVINKFN